MLRGLKSYKENAKLCYLAYHDALEVPQNVRPADGVFLYRICLSQKRGGMGVKSPRRRVR